MKLFFMSDIHGSATWLEKAINKFKVEKADYIVILGDLLYHGPRNPIPEGYDPQKVADILNEYKSKIVSVKGNCDGEVDQMLIDFPILAHYTIVFHNGRRIFATHGHKFNKDNMPNIEKGDIFIQGHTHVPVADEIEGIYILNPGSITLPKENNPNSYGIIEDDIFKVKDFDGHVLKECKFE